MAADNLLRFIWETIITVVVNCGDFILGSRSVIDLKEFFAEGKPFSVVP